MKDIKNAYESYIEALCAKLSVNREINDDELKNKEKQLLDAIKEKEEV